MTAAARLFISVAEDSADVHAGSLVRAARAQNRNWIFSGLTGPRLRALNVETVFDMASHAAMLGAAAGNVQRGRRALAAAEEHWKKHRPDLVIVMDSSALHLPLARRARRAGLRVLYYIAPQTWASRPWRNRALQRDVDRVACILPFEQAWFREHLILTHHVGHPLFEQLATEQPRDEVVARLRSSEKPVVAILPGSRRHVIDAMLPLQLEVVRRMRSAGAVVQPVVSCVASDRVSQIRKHIIASGFAAEILVDDNASLLTAADLVLVASGTATLQTAYYRRPMVVMYDAGRRWRWPYRLVGRFLLRLPHLSLVNILAGARVVPEFMPFVTDVQQVAVVARQLLQDEAWRRIMVRQLDEVVRPLEGARASENVCALIAEMLPREVQPDTVAPAGASGRVVSPAG